MMASINRKYITYRNTATQRKTDPRPYVRSRGSEEGNGTAVVEND